MISKFNLFVTATAFATTIVFTAKAELLNIDDFSITGFAEQKLSEAVAGAQQAQGATGAMSQDLTSARKRYFMALQSGQGVREAGVAFQEQLILKDLWYLNISVVTGYGTDISDFLRKIAELDGGIRPPARRFFEDWVKDVRFHLGARNDSEPVLFSPGMYLGALEASEARGLIYMRARDRAELFASGIPPAELFSPEAFTKLIIEDHLANSNNPEIGAARQNPVEVAAELYSLFVKTFGQAAVLNASKILLDAELDKNGKPVSLEYMEFSRNTKTRARNLFDPFYHQFANTPKGFIVHTGAGTYGIRHWQDSFQAGVEYYEKLSAEYGEERLLEVAAAVLAVPKNPVGRLIDDSGTELQYPGWWLQALLDGTVDAAPSASISGVIQANDLAAIEAANKSVRFGVIEGVVEKVHVDDWAISLEMAGSGQRVWVQMMRSLPVELFFDQMLYGDDGMGLEGKKINVSGRIDAMGEGRWTILMSPSNADKITVLD